jgi:hypothetical protein
LQNKKAVSRKTGSPLFVFTLVQRAAEIAIILNFVKDCGAYDPPPV